MKSRGVFLTLCVALVCAMTVEQAKNIKIVHLAFSNHLDVGFTDYSRAVVNTYFTKFYPKAIETSKLMRMRGGRFIYTTKSWLVTLYLNCPTSLFVCPTAQQVDDFKAAIRLGDISWHAFPFNAQPEFMDTSLFEFGIHMSHRLDDQFNQTRKIVMGQRDVPGLTRSVIPLLVKNGVQAMSFGVNGASAPAVVPKVFKWQDTHSGKEVVVLYNPGGYGGVEFDNLPFVNGFDQTIAFSYRGDNDGPHSEKEVLRDIESLQKLFPNAEVRVSPFDDYFKALLRFNPVLPVVTSEIGDTWLYGVPSDPLKVSIWREFLRQRRSCIRQGECSNNDPRFFNFNVFLIKVAEHTWGSDTKMNLDFKNWSKKDLNDARENNPAYQKMEGSWVDQRSYLEIAHRSLGNHPLALRIRNAIQKYFGVTKPSLNGYTRVSPQRFRFGSVEVEFSNSGAISFLKFGERTISDSKHLLGEFLFQTFDQKDYDAFFNDYSYCPSCPWAPPDFLKPNMTLGKPYRSSVHATLREINIMSNSSGEYFIVISTMDARSTDLYGAPKEIWSTFHFPRGSTVLNQKLTWLGKSASRLPESLWISFNPIVDSKKWVMDKMEIEVSPFDIVRNGSRHQHGVWDYIRNTDGVTIHTIDAPVVSPMSPIPFPSPLNSLNVEGGMHFNLYNNIWGTNYIMWYPYSEDDVNTNFEFVFEMK
jgi:hypothetical protein